MIDPDHCLGIGIFKNDFLSSHSWVMFEVLGLGGGMCSPSVVVNIVNISYQAQPLVRLVTGYTCSRLVCYGKHVVF